MTTDRGTEGVLDVNIQTRYGKPLSSWRRFYLRLLEELAPRSIVEFGCGPVDFLARVPETMRRVGIDGNPNYAGDYASAGIEFHACDFNAEDPPPSLKEFEAAVCSDVFEHLLYPEKLLGGIAKTLARDGVLISHVPNEFRFGDILPIQRGRAGSVVFHKDTEEWNNPHLRRFTDLGYQRFLALEFEFSLPLTHLNPRKLARRLMRFGLPVPFGLQGGPTYASTNSRETRDRLQALLERMSGG